MHQTELLDSKDRISNVDLRIETWSPTAGSCSPQGLTGSVTDSGLDSQALVSANGVGGKCARARLIPTGIHSGGVTVHAFCYFAGVDDEDSN